jgi:hypothetical protein
MKPSSDLFQDFPDATDQSDISRMASGGWAVLFLSSQVRSYSLHLSNEQRNNDMIDRGLGGLTIPETNQKPELFSSSKIVYFAALKGKGRNCYFFGEIWKIHESMEKYWKEIAEYHSF